MHRLIVAYSVGQLYNKKEYALRACGVAMNPRRELKWVTKILHTGTENDLVYMTQVPVTIPNYDSQPFFPEIKRGQYVTMTQFRKIWEWAVNNGKNGVLGYLNQGEIRG